MVDIAKALTRTGIGLSMLSRSPSEAQFGQQQFAQQQQHDELAQKTNQQVQLKILDAHIQALGSGKYTKEEAIPLVTNTLKLAQATGADVGDAWAFYVPKEAAQGFNLGPQQQRFNADGTLVAENKNQRAGAMVRPQVISPGAQMVDAEGKVLAENKNPRFAPPRPAAQTRGGFQQQRMANTQAAYDEADQKYQKSGNLADLINLSNRRIDKRVGDGLGGVGEAGKLREKNNALVSGLQNYDGQYKKAIEILDKTPDVITVAGPAANAILAMGQNALGLVSLIPGVDPNMSIKMEDFADELSATSLGNTNMRAILYNLAIQSAVANGLDKGGFNKQEIKDAIRNIGGTTTSPQGLRTRLKEVRSQLANSLKNHLNSSVDNYSGVSEADPTQSPSIDDRLKKYVQ